MEKITEGTLINVEYYSTKTTEIVNNEIIGKSEREFSKITLDTGDTFILSGKAGHKLEADGAIGHRLKITQKDGMITVQGLQ